MGQQHVTAIQNNDNNGPQYVAQYGWCATCFGSGRSMVETRKRLGGEIPIVRESTTDDEDISDAREGTTSIQSGGSGTTPRRRRRRSKKKKKKRKKSKSASSGSDEATGPSSSDIDNNQPRNDYTASPVLGDSSDLKNDPIPNNNNNSNNIRDGSKTDPRGRRKRASFSNSPAEIVLFSNNNDSSNDFQFPKSALSRRNKKRGHQRGRSSSMDASSGPRIRFSGIEYEPDYPKHKPFPERSKSSIDLFANTSNNNKKNSSSGGGGGGRERVRTKVKFTSGDIKSFYEITKVELGQGATGNVFMGIAKKTKEQFAIKIISKSSWLMQDNQFLDEIDILSKIKHPNIIGLVDKYQDSRNVYLVLELAQGGELFDRIVDKKVFPEKYVKRIAASLIDAIAYLHSTGVTHRDLKPENILFMSQDPDADIRISDFGFAKHLNNAEQLMRATARRGTMGYAAPEILSGKPYDEKCDVWSVGVILYIMLSGIPPFVQIENPEKALTVPFWRHAKDAKPTKNLQFPQFFWKHVTEKAQSFVESMLRKDPVKRKRAQDLLRHPWLKGAKRLSASASTSDRQKNFLSQQDAFMSMR